MKIVKVKRNNLKEIIKEAVRVLKNGGIVIYPTETCYGVGVDATNRKAVVKLLQYKKRAEGKAISIAVSSRKMAEKYVYLNETAKNLYQNFLPGPLTVISKSRGKTAFGLEAEDGTLGVRVPDYSLIVRTIRLLGKPITATSANVSFKKTPYSIEDILKNTTKKQQDLIDLILDAGVLPKREPSTVVDTTLNKPSIIREGKIDLTRPALRKENSCSEEETKKIAQNLIKSLINQLKNNCIIFALQGELGVGKTQFAKGLARSLGIAENITSPTFVLVKEYKFSVRCQASGVKKSKLKTTKNQKQATSYLYHIDTWRMRNGKELLDLGFYKMLMPGNVIIIEWLEKVKGILQKVEKRKDVKVIWVMMEHKNKNKREIKILKK